MVKVEMEIVQVLCDFCKEIAILTCQVCGSDLCNKCYGKIVSVNPDICHTDGKLPFHLRKDLEEAPPEFQGHYYRNCMEGIYLCPIHYQEIEDYLNTKVIAIAQKDIGGDITR